MPDAPRKTIPGLVPARNLAAIVGAWFVAAWLHAHVYLRAEHDWIHDAINRVFGGFPALAEYVQMIWEEYATFVGWTAGGAIVLATALFPLGFAVRLIARARLRAGHADPLDRVRTWISSRPRASRALLAAVPVVLWTPEMINIVQYDHPRLVNYLALVCGPVALAAVAFMFIAKRWLDAFLAPTFTGDQPAARFEIGADEIVFDAVAVTRETLAAVAGLALLALLVAGWLASLRIHVLYQTLVPLYVMGGYAAVAGASAFAFRRASRVAVGVDGVHVRGTSRARFFAYRDIDSARANGGDIELVRRGRVVLRLQLHGEDAARREAVLARITENLASVKEGRGAVAAQLVASSSKEALARVAHGAADYRMATLTREQLWALVEGPEVEASARKAAAEALAASGDDRERTRLRVAAEHCAEPHVRVALQEIAGAEEPEARSARAARVV